MTDQLYVYRNPGRSRAVIPYVVVVQSNEFRAAARRIVLPLVTASAFAAADSDVGPHFQIEGRTVILDPLQITNVPSDVLGPPIGSLVDQEDRVMRALDIVLSRAWR